jgi:hypothetical protein
MAGAAGQVRQTITDQVVQQYDARSALAPARRNKVAVAAHALGAPSVEQAPAA